MKLHVSAAGIADIDVAALVVVTPKFDKLSDKTLARIDAATGNALTGLLESEEFVGDSGQAVTLFCPAGFRARRIIVAGAGEKTKIDADAVRRALGKLSRDRDLISVKTAAVVLLGSDPAEFYGAAVEGFLLGSFKMLDFKTGDARKDPNKLTDLTLIAGTPGAVKKIEKAVTRGEIIAEGQLTARRLATTPANELTPKKYATEVQKLAKKHGFACKVLDEKVIAKEKMGGLLSVARGSAEPPRFLILELMNGPKGQAPIVLIGKGVTFDTGGISIKPAANMHEMKQDMAGSAAVVGTMMAAARLDIKRNIVGLIPSTENMPSGTATKPGDIITMRSGKTVEVINTDAEGRLILADALDYANIFKPQAVIDICTLTGATLFILGYSGAPITGNNKNLTALIEASSERTAERVWTMPIWDDFRDAMKSTIADLVNSGGRPAGTLTAAAFLENFVGDWPWAHIDIAYVDLEPKGTAYTPAGPSGFGVRLLTDMLDNWKKV
jgi:leucyl aminopeptidase